MGTHPQEDGVTGKSTGDSLTVWGMSPTTYAYDANGNLISETTGDKVKSYSYDGFNRLTEVTNPDGTWQGNMYDALGMRSAILENGIWTGFGYDGGNVISEQDARGKSTAFYVRGLGLIAQKDSKGAFGYYLNNAHGDVTGIVDTAGTVLNSYTYDAYGNVLDSTEKVANRFTYSGEQVQG